LNDSVKTRVAGIGGAGHEFAPLAQNVTFTLVTPDTSDGTLQQGVQVVWTNPGGEFFGDVELIYTPDGGTTFYSLGPSSKSPFTRWISPPDPAAIWTFYLVSRDVYGRSNTIAADTPAANLVMGISSTATGGTLDFSKAKATTYDPDIFKVQAGKFIIWAMDGSLILRGTLNVGGGTDMPDKLVVWDGAGNQIMWVGKSGTDYGTWTKSISIGGTNFATGKIKSDPATGNVSVTDATIKVTSGATNIYLDPTNGLKVVKNEGLYNYEQCVLTSADVELSHMDENLTATPHSVLLSNHAGQLSELMSGFLYTGGVQVVGARGAAVADPTGGSVIDVQCRAQLSALLARLRAATGHGLIA
jgi:hypothetical protein